MYDFFPITQTETLFFAKKYDSYTQIKLKMKVFHIFADTLRVCAYMRTLCAHAKTTHAHTKEKRARKKTTGQQNNRKKPTAYSHA